jgi:hypothetical protein
MASDSGTLTVLDVLATGRHPRHVFGLAGGHDVLCELHADKVTA